MSLPEDLETIVLGLHSIGAVRFGEFQLKSGLISPIYIDLRLVPSRPSLLRKVARSLSRAASGLRFDRIAAIPYGGLPIGVALSLEMDKPLIYPRGEVKRHGTRRAVEGMYQPGDTVLVVDDLISTGDSKIEAIEPLLSEGLQVQDILVLIDRQQGGKQLLAESGYTLHALLSLPDVLGVLAHHGKATGAQLERVHQYLRGE